MSWADYTNAAPGLKICETCALQNLKETLDFFEDEYDETDLLTLERAIDLVSRLNQKDYENGAEDVGDDKYRPVPFNPKPGMTCVQCRKEAA